MASLVHIPGAVFEDERGLLTFFNTFDMSAVKRLYQIAPANTQIIRAWQGHQIEQKWFYCIQGSFLIQTVAIDDFDAPSPKAEIQKHQLSEKEPKVMHLPGGHASGIQATAPNSVLLVFSDVTLDESKADDYRFQVNYWKTEWMVSSQ